MIEIPYSKERGIRVTDSSRTKGIIMKNWKRLRVAMAVYCCSSLVLTQPICWAQQAQVAPTESFRIADIALDEAGSLRGLVVGGEGQAIAGAPVIMTQGDAKIVETATDQMGQFSVQSLRGGVYEMQVNADRFNVRVWAPQTAPPTATTGFTYVLGTVQRGQCTEDSCTGVCGGTCGAAGAFGGGPLGLLMNPWVIGAAVAAAIAIPLALDDDDDAS